MIKVLDRRQRAIIEDKARKAALAAIVEIRKTQHAAYAEFLAIREERYQVYDEVYKATYADLRAKAEEEN